MGFLYNRRINTGVEHQRCGQWIHLLSQGHFRRCVWLCFAFLQNCMRKWGNSFLQDCMRKWAEPHCRVPSSQYNGNRRREIVWSGADIISYCLRRAHTRASMSNPLPLIRCFAWDARGHTHEQKQGQEGGVCTEGSWQRLLLQQRWMGRLQTTFIHNGIWQQSTSFPRFLGDKDKKLH